MASDAVKRAPSEAPVTAQEWLTLAQLAREVYFAAPDAQAVYDALALKCEYQAKRLVTRTDKVTP